MLFCRLEDRAPQSANVSSGALNSDLVELNQRSRYNTFQYNERALYYNRRNNFACSQQEKPYARGEVERTEINQALYGIYGARRSVEAWGKAAEECRRNRSLYAHRSTASANLKTLPEEDIAQKSNSRGEKIV